MSTKLPKLDTSKSKQQEVMMREVLGGLEEIATMLSYNPWPGDFEIIAIYPPEQENGQQREKTVVSTKPTPKRKISAAVISFAKLKKARLKLSA